MRFGVLTSALENAESIARAGFDCAELNVSAVMVLDETGFKATKKLLKSTGLCFDVFDEPLPSEVQICIRGFNKFIWREYLKKVCFRVSELDGKSLIFRNGISRSIPLEGDLEGAREKVMVFILTLCEIAEEYNIKVIIEPLTEHFSNMYNTLEECSALIKLLGVSNLTSMCGLRYFTSTGSDTQDIIKHKEIISHALIDCKAGDGSDYSSFFDAFDKIHYDGIVSLDADKYEDYHAELTRSLAFLKSFSTGG